MGEDRGECTNPCPLSSATMALNSSTSSRKSEFSSRSREFVCES